MDDDKKTVESLEQVFAAGDAWLRKYGMVTSIAHNAIVANLYVNFSKVRYLEYFLPEDTTRRKVWVVLYVPFWKMLFTNRDRMIDDVIAFLRDYLNDYDIKVELKRYKKGVEKSDEIPKQAADHVSDNVHAGDDLPKEGSDLQSVQPPETVPPEPAPEAGREASQDQGSPVAAASEPGDVPPVPDSSGA